MGTKSKLSVRKIRKFILCFQMTSFGTTKIVQNNDGRYFQTRIKVKG